MENDLIYHMKWLYIYSTIYPRVFILQCDLERYISTIGNEDYSKFERDENYVKVILLTK